MRSRGSRSEKFRVTPLTNGWRIHRVLSIVRAWENISVPSGTFWQSTRTGLT
ncbi:hypothetical protein CKAH01_12100 [Colletotrichum kahawae]|uniref:Uncharacterized protein n=1 Tax=Colletotrichum kahawae TaxID=34407 RepID=A0AAE0DD84_COLKA|nr:hypothetical protein CKAH01_12100 [Colletotrichum kahawae]